VEGPGLAFVVVHGIGDPLRGHNLRDLGDPGLVGAWDRVSLLALVHSCSGWAHAWLLLDRELALLGDLPADTSLWPGISFTALTFLKLTLPSEVDHLYLAVSIYFALVRLHCNPSVWASLCLRDVYAKAACSVVPNCEGGLGVRDPR